MHRCRYGRIFGFLWLTVGLVTGTSPATDAAAPPPQARHVPESQSAAKGEPLNEPLPRPRSGASRRIGREAHRRPARACESPYCRRWFRRTGSPSRLGKPPAEGPVVELPPRVGVLLPIHDAEPIPLRVFAPHRPGRHAVEAPVDDDAELRVREPPRGGPAVERLPIAVRIPGTAKPLPPPGPRWRPATTERADASWQLLHNRARAHRANVSPSICRASPPYRIANRLASLTRRRSAVTDCGDCAVRWKTGAVGGPDSSAIRAASAARGFGQTSCGFATPIASYRGHPVK